jgi:hypothetical protein
MMNNPFSTLFDTLSARRRARQFEAFREFMATYEKSKRWVAFPCPLCAELATSPYAKFCAFCGASFASVRVQAGLQMLSNIGTGNITAPQPKLHPLMQGDRNTGPVRLPERPCKVLAQAGHEQDTGPNTALHRAINAIKERQRIR